MDIQGFFPISRPGASAEFCETRRVQRKVIFASSALLACMLATGWSPSSLQRPEVEVRTAVVGVLEVRPQSASVYNSYVANIQAQYTVEIRSRVDG